MHQHLSFAVDQLDHIGLQTRPRHTDKPNPARPRHKLAMRARGTVARATPRGRHRTPRTSSQVHNTHTHTHALLSPLCARGACVLSHRPPSSAHTRTHAVEARRPRLRTPPPPTPRRERAPGTPHMHAAQRAPTQYICDILARLSPPPMRARAHAHTHARTKRRCVSSLDFIHPRRPPSCRPARGWALGPSDVPAAAAPTPPPSHRRPAFTRRTRRQRWRRPCPSSGPSVACRRTWASRHAG